LRGGAGSADADAWYYDPAIDEHRVVLDTTTEESVHPAALAEFRARHSGADNDREFARFLANLRRELITWKGGVPRPWDDPREPWSSIGYLCT